MKKKRVSNSKFLAAVFIFFFSAVTSAQDLPKIPAEITMFYEYEGSWQGEGSMTMGGEVSKGTVKHYWSKIADGWGMLIDEELDIPAMGKKYIGHNILGYDIGEKMYHLYTIDNFADVHDHKGPMKEDKTIYLEHNGVTPDGKTYKEKLKLQIINNVKMMISGEAFSEGNTAFTFEAVMEKSK
jgi:hypothetical protein